MEEDQHTGKEKAKLIGRHLSRAFLRMVPLVPGPEILDLLNDLSKSRTALDEKIELAYGSLQETSGLISELETGLNERVEKVKKLRMEYDRYSKLATVEEEEAKAIIEQLELTVGKGKSKERLISLFINLAAGIVVFILGVILGPHLIKAFGMQ